MATVRPSPMRAISPFIIGRPWLLAGAAVATLAASVAEIAFPWLLQRGVDAAVGAPTDWTLGGAAAAMLAVIVGIVAFHAATLVFETLMFASASFDLRKRIYTHIERLPFAALAAHRTGSLSFRAAHDVSSLETNLSELFGEGLFDLLVALGAVAAMTATSLRLTAAVALVMILASSLSARLGRSLPVYKRAEQMLSARLAGKLQESVAGAKTIRALCAEASEVARLDADNANVRGIDIRAGVLKSLITPLWNFAEALGIIVVLAYGGSLVAHKSISIGALVGFLAYQQLLAGPINRFGDYIYLWRSCWGVATRVVGLFGAQRPAGAGGRIERPAGMLSVDQLEFSYPGSRRKLIRGISFSVPPGEHVAIVGRNGEGKSSLFDLLMGLREPTAGRIALGDARQDRTDPEAWRSAFGLMLQETFLLRGALAENLLIARPGATPEDMLAALAAAGARSLAERLGAGLDSEVGERGQNLSGGERQLVGLARLILREPGIVLLDEPTAHLDGAARTTVLEALRRFCQGRTLLLITHDPDLLALVDRAIVLDHGRIAADGPPGELKHRSALYRELVGDAAAAGGAAMIASPAPPAVRTPVAFADARAAVAALQPDTPLHCLRPHVIQAQARQFAAAFPGQVLYAMKANPDPTVLAAAWAGGVRGFDVASIGEIEQAASLMPEAKLHFMNPMKSRTAIRRAYFDFGIRTFALDTEAELEKILTETGRPKDLDLLVRVATPDTWSAWRVSQKFGAAGGEAVQLFRAARAAVGRAGLTFHVGSLCLDPAAYVEAMKIAGAVAREAGGGLDLLDVGGGFPVAYEGLRPPPLSAFVKAIVDGLEQVPLTPAAELWAEPGRALAAPGGSVVVRVLGRRGSRLYLNDGFYGGLASPGPPPPHLGLPLRVLAVRRGAPTPFEVFGPTCDGTDRLGGPFVLPDDLQEGDFIEVGQHGAYGACLRTDFNGLLPSGVVHVRDGPLLETPGFQHPADRNIAP